MFRRYFQFCRSAFKRKEGRKVVTWKRERGDKGIRGPMAVGRFLQLEVL